jgi:hypothetical protein
MRNDCFELVGYPPGWKRRPQNRPVRESNTERRFNHSHLSAATDETQVAAGIQALEEFKEKMMTATTHNPEAASCSSDAQGANFSLNSWIIDSGATNHMTGSPKDFITYMPHSGKDRVCIANGSTTPIMGYGTINCTPSLPPSLVLHVPKIYVYLLSVSSITKTLNCIA